MRDVKSGVSMAWTVVTAFAMPVAWGDAPCDKGYRDATADETAAMTRTLETARSALPAAPAGWVVVSDDSISVVRSICQDDETTPWRYKFGRSYQRVDDQEARNKILADAAAKAAAAHEAKKPRLDAAQARAEKLVKAQVALMQKGDMAGAQAVNDELAKVQEEIQKIMEEGDSAQQLEAAAEEASRDLHMSITVDVNPNSASGMGESASIPPPAGALKAFRWSHQRGDVKEDQALILLGQWKQVDEGIWKPVRRANAAPAAAHALTVHVSADADRLAPTVGTIDFGKIASVLR